MVRKWFHTRIIRMLVLWKWIWRCRRGLLPFLESNHFERNESTKSRSNILLCISLYYRFRSSKSTKKRIEGWLNVLVGKVFSPNKRHVGGSFADFTVIKPREYFTKLHTIAHVRGTHGKLIASTLITWVILNERKKSNWLSFLFLFLFISTFIVSTYMATC